MSSVSLTARYRPQTFAEVAGQDTLKAILSRAAQEDKVAPAYLFSGTRGVGKTTLARIFAKALNCRKGPASEPCNQCDVCRSVTQGNAVDVVEIDGASNRGIDDVRRLKEVVGYAPMDGRYKVFIIDEAHMLSREAFNALLKTLEEPPAGVTFIMATTEPHKFPATIISRCQHYVFKRLPEARLVDHLRGVLEREGVDYEEAALRLIARRGAGSVRDAMSLLGQVLALGEGRLSEQSSRAILGLAGQEAFTRILTACGQGDTLGLTRLLRELLDQGLDMGFFLRELTSLWRNLFILKQSGRPALDVVELQEEEAAGLLQAAEGFSLSHIHACWQMSIEGQRRVLTSLEPALSLELLLLNLAMMPKILSLESLSALGRKGGPPQGKSGPGQAAPGSGQADTGPVTLAGPSSGVDGPASAQANAEHEGTDEPSQGGNPEDATGSGQNRGQALFAGSGAAVQAEAGRATDASCNPENGQALEEDEQNDPLDGGSAGMHAAFDDQSRHAEGSLDPVQYTGGPQVVQGEQEPEGTGQSKPDWTTVLAECIRLQAPSWFVALARGATGRWEEDRLILNPADHFAAEQLLKGEAREILETALESLGRSGAGLEIIVPESRKKSRDQLYEEICGHPGVQQVEKLFKARIVDFGQLR